MTQAAILPEWMMQRRPDEVELAPDEATAFSLFASLGTQWRRHAMTGTRLGIDYAAIPPTAAMLGVTMTPAMLADIRMMEAEAMDIFARAEARR